MRPSDTFVGDYSLSFFRKGEVYHVPIRIRQLESGIKAKCYNINDQYSYLKSKMLTLTGIN